MIRAAAIGYDYRQARNFGGLDAFELYPAMGFKTFREKCQNTLDVFLSPPECAGVVAAFDADGWFRSGDLGRLDADGFLTITGRLKDVIIRKGENISAKEIEDLLHGHPDVAEAAVVGLPDPALGERCCAVVGVEPGRSFSFEAMQAYLRAEALMTQKIPEQLEPVDALPRNPAGKILKRVLIERFGAA